MIEDKTDSMQVEAIADGVLLKYEVSDEVDEANLKTALLSQLLRIAKPKSQEINAKSLQSEGFDADSIRRQGFDKVWQKISPVSSVVCHGTGNIDLSIVRELLEVVHKPPSLEEIHDGIRHFHDRTGKRPTFHQSEWMDELDRSARAVDKVCRRYYGTTLAKQVRFALGDANDDLLSRTHDLIREYWSKGIRIGNKYGELPEIGMTSFALNGRLTWNYNTTLAHEVEQILGLQAKPLTLPKVRKVIREYLRNGIRLHRKFGHIPELDMSSYNLADRLKRNFSVTLTEIVEEVSKGKAG
jgi:hypothetical protein